VLNKAGLGDLAVLRERFQAARPFRHLCLDGFLLPDLAEQALADFPAFDPALAINELGRAGGKAVNTRMAGISPFYRRLYDHLFSQDFLDTMSAITGIDGLIGDPTLYGGGTHENLHGQELDPHIDFNYLHEGRAHRRVNLLIYLNKDWDSAWGGDIELHSDPRHPQDNRIASYRVDFNRAVLFETNEHSWHGFPEIRLPDGGQNGMSRKCISIYLYTRERPPGEIAGEHGTFYVQRPLPEQFRPGHVLDQQDVQVLQRALRRRDEAIEAAQRAEERAGREKARVAGHIADLRHRARLPLLGHVTQQGAVEGAWWSDDWMGQAMGVTLVAERDLAALRLAGRVGAAGTRLRFTLGDSVIERVLGADQDFVVTMPVRAARGQALRLTVESEDSFNPAALGLSGDERDLSCAIWRIEAIACADVAQMGRMEASA
jgi:hypothetical protein